MTFPSGLCGPPAESGYVGFDDESHHHCGDQAVAMVLARSLRLLGPLAHATHLALGAAAAVVAALALVPLLRRRPGVTSRTPRPTQPGPRDRSDQP